MYCGARSSAKTSRGYPLVHPVLYGAFQEGHPPPAVPHNGRDGEIERRVLHGARYAPAGLPPSGSLQVPGGRRGYRTVCRVAAAKTSPPRDVLIAGRYQ